MVAAVVEQPRSPLAQVFSVPPLRYLGRISYGVYLYHWPLFLVLTRSRVGVSGWALVGVRVGVTLAVAIASYHLIERPIRQGRLRIWRPRLVAPASAITAVAVVATVLVVTTNISSPGSAGAIDNSTLTKLAQQAQADQQASVAPVVAPGSTDTKPVRISVVGDSVALTLAGNTSEGGLVKLAPSYGGTVINHGWVGCGIARNSQAYDGSKTYPDWGDCNRWDQVRRAEIAKDDPDAAAVLVGLWEMLDRKVDGRTLSLGMPEYDTYIGHELDTLIGILSAKGARVALLSPPCFKHADTPNGDPYPANSMFRLTRFHQLLDDAAKRSNGVATVIDLNPVLCPDGHFQWKHDGQQLRMDDGIHITPAGDALLAPTLMPQLVQLGKLRGVDLRTVPTGSLRPRPAS
jgi:hypothetical protein